MAESPDRWLLLIHQIPPRPSYFRVKVWRRLQRLGAVALKNSVYVLPRSEQTQEDFHWVSAEIVAEGGEATVCAARFIEGISDAQIEQLFRAARRDDYQSLAKEARQLAEGTTEHGDADRRAQVEVGRLRRRLDEIAALDFFAAPEGAVAERLVAGLEARLREPVSAPASVDTPKPAKRGHLKTGQQERARRMWMYRVGDALRKQRCGTQLCLKALLGTGGAGVKGRSGRALRACP